MKIYCVFKRISMNVFQSQYILDTVFWDEGNALVYIENKPDFHYETHEIQ